MLGVQIPPLQAATRTLTLTASILQCTRSAPANQKKTSIWPEYTYSTHSGPYECPLAVMFYLPLRAAKIARIMSIFSAVV